MNKKERKIRDKQIKEEFKSLYQKDMVKKLYVYDLLSKKHKLDVSTIERIIKPLQFGKNGGKLKSLEDYKVYLKEWHRKNREQNEAQ